MKKLTDKVVVITGAGSGIGRALAVEAAKRGALVAISDVNTTGLAETADMVRAEGCADVHEKKLDVADRAAFAAYAQEVAQHFGRVNAVINNAGVALAGPFEEIEYDDFEWIMGINFWGVVNGTKEFLPHLVESGDGHVVNISSLFGLLSIPGQSAYNATKYAVRGFSEALREEMIVAKRPVKVTVVHPGGIKTGIARNARVTEGEDAAATARTFDEKLARMTPEKAARIILDGMQKGSPRVLVGIDAHLLHNFAKFTGARYQDVVARTSGLLLPERKH